MIGVVQLDEPLLLDTKELRDKSFASIMLVVLVVCAQEREQQCFGDEA